MALAAAAVADAFRAVAVRDHYLHPTVASLHRSGSVSMIFFDRVNLAIVLFLVWLARSRSAAQELSHLFVPRRLVLDIGRASSSEWEQKRGTTLVNLWWAAWVAHAVVLVVVGRMAPGSMAVLVVAEALLLAAAVLLGLVIERVTAALPGRPS
ncbi:MULTISPECIES: DUF4328 domain-containing protein [Streptomyces]|uniref:DUF4328 domain-containing protein n=1 Tax=Streptomyces TaxID=1883 RepID=UPI00056AB590|nr:MULTISPECIES: DUF4328 domain-containing protein [Streptomyces]